MPEVRVRARRVLLVDDDADLTAVMDLFIRSAGSGSCVTAHSLDEVREHPEAIDCDLAIVDVNLGPGASGLDVAAWLRQRGFRGRLIFLTGHARSFPPVAAAAEAPGTIVLSKPLPADVLLGLLRDGAP